MQTSIPVLLPLGWTVRPETLTLGGERGEASSDLWDVWHYGVLDDMPVGCLGFSTSDFLFLQLCPSCEKQLMVEVFQTGKPLWQPTGLETGPGFGNLELWSSCSAFRQGFPLLHGVLVLCLAGDSLPFIVPLSHLVTGYTLGL